MPETLIIDDVPVGKLPPAPHLTPTPQRPARMMTVERPVPATAPGTSRLPAIAPPVANRSATGFSGRKTRWNNGD